MSNEESNMPEHSKEKVPSIDELCQKVSSRSGFDVVITPVSGNGSAENPESLQCEYAAFPLNETTYRSICRGTELPRSQIITANGPIFKVPEVQSPQDHAIRFTDHGDGDGVQ